MIIEWPRVPSLSNSLIFPKQRESKFIINHIFCPLSLCPSQGQSLLEHIISQTRMPHLQDWSNLSFKCWHQVYLNQTLSVQQHLWAPRSYWGFINIEYPFPNTLIGLDPKTILLGKPALAPLAKYRKPIISNSILLQGASSSHTFPKEMTLKLDQASTQEFKQSYE